MNKINREDAGSIRAAIKSVSNRARTLQGDIQRVALATLYHTTQHGDWTLCRELIEGVSSSRGVKAAKLTQWYEAFMHATYTKNEAGEMAFIYDTDKSAADISLEQAELVNWYDFKAEPQDKTKTLEAIRESVAKMLAASLKTNKVTEQEQSVLMDIFDDLLVARELDVEVALNSGELDAIKNLPAALQDQAA